MSEPFSEVMAEIMAGCPHRDVIPILPAHIASMWSTVEGVCVDCGDGPFTMWEAYGYGDAHAERPYPDLEEVLLDFEAWWSMLGR